MPIPFLAIAAGLSALQAGIGGVQSLQAAKTRREAERNFDKFQVPQGINSMMDLLQGMASQNEIPGADIARQRIATGTARGVEVASRMASSSSDVLGSLHRMYSNQQDRELELAMAGAQQKQQNQMRLAQGMQTLGAYQTQKWQYNELYPYMQKMTEAGQLAAAGSANISGAIQSGVNLLGTAARLDALGGLPTGDGADKSGNASPEVNGLVAGNAPQMNKNFWMDNPLSPPQQQQALPAFSNGAQTNQNPWMKNVWGATAPPAQSMFPQFDTGFGTSQAQWDNLWGGSTPNAPRPYDINRQYNAPWF